MIQKNAKDVPCHVCKTNTATTEYAGFPVCADCLAKNKEKLEAESKFL